MTKRLSVDGLIAADRRAGLGILSASIFSSWVWTLTLLGSTEAGTRFGVTGGFHYAWGAIIPFFLFVPVALRLRRIMPAASTFSEFIHVRFDKTTHLVFIAFGIGVSMYVYVQQLIGAGILFETSYGIPFKIGVVLTGLLVGGYITFYGLKGSLLTDLLQFFVIAIGCITLIPWLLIEVGGIEFVYNGLVKVATDPANPNHNDTALSWFSPLGIRYGIAVVAICLGQILFEQGYFQRAVAASDTDSLKKAYIIGGAFAWMAVPLAFGLIVGGVGLALGVESGSNVAPYLFSNVLGPVAGLIFVIMTFMAATSTADTSLSGIQSILTGDYYDQYVRDEAQSNEHKQIRFGRIATLIAAMSGIGLALFLEGRSLLEIDICSGIVFAAPVASFLAGLYSERITTKLALSSIVVGLASGISAWLLIPNDDLNWFIGNILALCLPAVVIAVGYPLTKANFQFADLRDWRPRHKVSIDNKEEQ